MEKKKLLLVAISVGIFLVIAIGAAIVVFAPKTGPVPAAAAASRSGQGVVFPPYAASPDFYDYSPVEPENLQPSTVDPVDILRNPDDISSIRPVPEGTPRHSSDFYIIPGPVIEVPEPGRTAVPGAPAPSRTSPTPVSPPVSNTPTAPPVAPAPTPSPTPAASAPAPRPAVQVRPAVVQTRVYDDYWVQTGAFSTIARAEGVKETLSSRGITSIIENRDIEGRTVFRVRVGPYTSHNEADYWLSLIKSINGFEESQIRQTQSRR
jgi:DedD protein